MVRRMRSSLTSALFIWFAFRPEAAPRKELVLSGYNRRAKHNISMHLIHAQKHNHIQQKQYSIDINNSYTIHT